MLKVVVHEDDDEKRGNLLMAFWDGRGAAQVLAHDGEALLMERARAGMSLADLVSDGRDDEASRTMCEVLGRLHAPRSGPYPDLVPLARWFEPLRRVGDEHGGVFRGAAARALKLLSDQGDVVVLHGDMHHGNVLNFGDRGWLAIDPKGLFGERGFDYANILCNPDSATATDPGRLLRQAQVIAETADLDRHRLFEWIVAWAGLRAAFSIEDGLAPEPLAISVLKIASSNLAGEAPSFSHRR